MPNANNLPVHAQKIVALGGSLTSAMTSPSADAPAGLVLLGTVDTNSLLDRMWALPRASTVAGNLLLYRKPANSTHYQLIDSLTLPLFNTSTTAGRPYYEFTRYTNKNPFKAAAGDSFYAGGEVAQPGGIDVNITGTGT